MFSGRGTASATQGTVFSVASVTGSVAASL